MTEHCGHFDSQFTTATIQIDIQVIGKCHYRHFFGFYFSISFERFIMLYIW